MKERNELLILSAARLYSVGVDMEGAREKLRQLVEAGVPYEDPEMLAALKEFRELEASWRSLEAQHLSLREKMGLP